MSEEDNVADPLKEVVEKLGDAPIPVAHGIAAIALSMAMKYHDISTVQDGTLYQQYKMEGRNLIPLDLEMVFETAIRIEHHLMESQQRIADLVVEAIEAGVEAMEEGAEPERRIHSHE